MGSSANSSNKLHATHLPTDCSAPAEICCLENRSDHQEGRVNLSGERKKRGKKSWAGLPTGAESAEEPLGERTGPESGLCVGGGHGSQY